MSKMNSFFSDSMHIVRTTTDEQSGNRSEEDYERDERKKKYILAGRWKYH